MFTGIIEELGQVRRVYRSGNFSVIDIVAGKVCVDTKVGESIAVNGVCLTVVKNINGVLSFEVMPETLKFTNLGVLKLSEKVNLERSLKVGERVSGHFVLGHVDCLGLIRRKFIYRGNLRFDISLPVKYMKFCLIKNSIAIDGVSLTIQDRKSSVVSVYIIPLTLKNTTLDFRNPSDKVNIEFDSLIKNSVSSVL